MDKTEKRLRPKNLAVFLAILYSFIVAGAGAYTWFVCMQATALMFLIGGASFAYRFYQMVTAIVLGIIFIVGVTWGHHAFEKAITRHDTWFPRPFLVALGVEAVIWGIARLVVFAYIKS